jgi:hypothetical protein
MCLAHRYKMSSLSPTFSIQPTAINHRYTILLLHVFSQCVALVCSTSASLDLAPTMRYDNVSTSTPTAHTIPSPLPPAQKSLALYHLRSMSLPISCGRQQHSILLSPMGLGSIRLTSQFWTPQHRLTSEWYHAPVSNFYMKTDKDGWGLDTGHTGLLLSLLSWVSCRHANFSLIDVIVGLS